MRGFGSAWWHVPLLLVALGSLGCVALVLAPARERFFLVLPAIVILAFVLVWRDRRIYLPSRLEAQKAGSIKRAELSWPIAALVWFAFSAVMQFAPHRYHSRVAATLEWIGIMIGSCAAVWQLVFSRRRLAR